MLNNIINIWLKELLDSVRDRKGMLQAILLPLFLGFGYAILNPLLASSMRTRAQEPVFIPTIGIENADESFIEFLGTFEITLEPYDGDLEADVERGAVTAGLIIPADFSDQLESELPAELTLIVNPTAGGPFGGGFSTGRLDLALTTYGQAVAAQRVAARGVDPGLMAPLALRTQDLSTAAQRGGVTAAFMLPILVGIIAAQGGMFVAIDVTAGEKERGTLEALLVTPATDVEIFLGKLGAVFTITLVPLTLAFLAFWAGSNFLPDSVTDGAVFPLVVIVRTILIAVPLALFINAVLMIIAIRTKAFKDAQSAMTPAIFGVLIPSMVAAFVPPSSALAFAIPVYGTAAIVGTIATSGVVPAGAIAYSIGGSLVAALLAIMLALRLFNRERLLYAA